MDERRDSYRIREGLEGVKISVPSAGQNEVDARLMDLSAKGAAIVIPASLEALATLPPGTEVQLTFAIPGLEPLTGLRAVVRHERTEGADHIVGVEILDWERLHEALPHRLFTLFNRRRDFRVTLHGEQAVHVSVRLEDDEALSAHLLDISASGCALLIEPDPTPAVNDEVCLSFRLPDEDYWYHLGGTVRSRAEVGDALRCGIEFRQTRSLAFADQQQRITNFVVAQQRKQLRQRVTRDHDIKSA